LKEKAGFLCYKGVRPVVVFPEATKTNGLGILNLERDVVRMVVEAGGLNGNLRVHSIRFDHQYIYFAAYNTTDAWGLRHLVSVIS